MAVLSPPVAAAFQAVGARLKSLSKPARVLAGSTVALAVLFAGILLYRASHEPYAVLFAQLDQDDAAGIVAKLKELKGVYRLDTGGTVIEVPEAKVAELRMELAGAGLPRGGGIGFESFDKLRLGATEFEQRVLYRRALEGELARTIGALASIQTSRVHLVMPEKSVFVARTEPASASVMVHLRSGRSLGQSEVQGIVHLVAASVPGLTADHIALVTSDGQMLKKPRTGGDGKDGEGSADGELVAAQRSLEAQLEERARSMLEKVVGPGHVDVRVTAELDPGRVEHTEDHYDPARTALRSEELTRERSGLAQDDSVGGVPGAESNGSPLPLAAAAPSAPPAPSASASSTSPPAAASAPTRTAPPPVSVARGNDQPFRESHTRNFEVDHVSEKRSVAAGAVKRIGVAVILDGVAREEGGKRVVAARSQAELDRLAALVRSAVGASSSRGDSITVDSVPFLEAAAEVVPEVAPPSALLAAPRAVKVYGGAGVGAALLLGATVFALRGRSRRRRQEAAANLLPPVLSVPTLEPAVSHQDLRTRALERAASDPATAALVVRFWLGTAETPVKV